MTNRQLSVRDAYDLLRDELAFIWLAGRDGGDRPLTRNADPGQRHRLLGTLNFNSPNRIQLLGAAETRLFSANEGAALDPARFEYPLADTCDLVIVTDDLAPPPAIKALCDRERIPLFGTPFLYSDLHKSLRHLLTQQLAERRIIHGVMMDVHGTGVLITGDASVGKSELALELISRGHILVADDAPEFTRIAPGKLECQCPSLLQDFLEVRGLGVLNIALMYGDAHTRASKILRCIVHLQPVSSTQQADGDRIQAPSATREILGVAIPIRTIPVAPGRNLSVLVEAAVRDQILLAGGYNASVDLIAKQARALAGVDRPSSRDLGLAPTAPDGAPPQTGTSEAAAGSMSAAAPPNTRPASPVSPVGNESP